MELCKELSDMSNSDNYQEIYFVESNVFLFLPGVARMLLFVASIVVTLLVFKVLTDIGSCG